MEPQPGPNGEVAAVPAAEPQLDRLGRTSHSGRWFGNDTGRSPAPHPAVAGPPSQRFDSITDTCKSRLTASVDAKGRGTLTSEELLALLAAVGHAQRLRIIGELAAGRVHVSELARRLQLSRPLLYMHLERLEKAGLVVGKLELSSDGKAMKYFDVAPFELRLNVEAVLAALREDREKDSEESTEKEDRQK